jgi:hypothetical protein
MRRMAHQQTNENLCFSLRLCVSALSYLQRRTIYVYVITQECHAAGHNG